MNPISRRLPTLLLPLLLAGAPTVPAFADTAPTRGTLTPDVQAARPVPAAAPGATPRSVHLLLGSVPAYALEMTLSFTRYYTAFDASAPTNFAAVGPPPPDPQLWTGTFVRNDFSKQYFVGNANRLTTISTADGTPEEIGDAVPPVEGEFWVGMKWDPVTDNVYAAACNHVVGVGCNLYTIDTVTAAVTPVAPIAGGSGDFVLMDLAINSVGEIYAINLVDPYDNYLVKVNKTTGDVDVIGPTGVNAAYAQGMDFDKRTDTLYWAAFGALGAGGAFQGQVYTVDTATGAVTHLGTTPNGGSEVWSLSIATSAPAQGASWNFDDVTAPALPAGWTTDASGAGTAFATQTAVFDGAPNAAYVPEPAAAGESSLYSPVVHAGANDELAFRHRWAHETSPYDGGVLEIAIDGAPFQDIVTAGGAFVSGGYTATLPACCGGNPLGARAAWAGGTRNTFLTTRVTLPAAAANRDVRFRWRFGTDSSSVAPAPNGWWIDSVTLGAAGPTGPAAALSANALTIDVEAGETRAERVTIANVGTAALNFTNATASSQCAMAGDAAWLTATPVAGTLAAGDSIDVWVAADASALAAGPHDGVLCVTTNDPAHPSFAVPVAATVTPPSAADTIFRDGFDGAGGNGGDIVASGPLNWPVPADIDGLAIDLVTGEHGPWREDFVADVNLYLATQAPSPSLYVYWYADMVANAAVGGVIDVNDTGAVRYSVLQRGRTVGPDGTIWYAQTSKQLENWTPGATGYLGFKFYNEATGQVNYGYVHLKAAAGNGYPATVLDYAYDRTGNAIVVP
ncbi:BACON domain-containing protein [Tahibacter soli]|uniref:BACON domain-containing protein n=1 Tax=Tahibacter soli TaxID=2983605 RepID=A0A9X3YK94_9GAMM|nr:hypothetical protein [Tahibacter soli]MDC8012755.1 hypothetical protein [Tahibacter soli]